MHSSEPSAKQTKPSANLAKEKPAPLHQHAWTLDWVKGCLFFSVMPFSYISHNVE